MFGRILDRLFGKRYREGWPRGVRPCFPFIDEVREADPDLWETDWWRDPLSYMRLFVARNPDHRIASEARRPGSFFYQH